MKCFIILLAIVASVLSETKIWNPKQRVDEWYAHPIKCPKTALKFEEGGALDFFEGNSHEKSIVFSQNGWWIFQNDAHIVIGDSPNIDVAECASAFGKEITVHSPKAQPWSSPSNWDSETNGNPAKPDIEKIPCDYDEIVFNTSTIRVDLDGIFQLQMKRIMIRDKWLRPREFGSFCKTVPGQKMFENSESVDIEELAGEATIRACQSNAFFYQSLVCENVKCTPAKCMNPIRPNGFCCPLCGSSVSVQIHHDSNVKLSDLNSALSRKLAKLPTDGLSFYSSYFNDKTKFILQINIVERGEYTGDSVIAMDKIASDLLGGFGNFDIQKSGMPYDPTEQSNVMALVLLPLLFVVSVFLVAYKMTYDDNFQLNWRPLLNRWTGRSQFIFAQFENVLEDQEGRITISHSVTEPVVETGMECRDASGGIEMVAGGPEEKSSLPKDKLDEIVETISTSESVNLISVDM